MMEKSRFLVTKSDDSSQHQSTSHFNPKNTIDFKNIKENEPNSGTKIGRNRWKNAEQSYTNNAFALDDMGDEDIIDHFQQPNTSQRSEANPLTKKWDKFVTLPPEEDDDTLSTEWVNVFISFFKVIIYLFTFIVLLFCAILSITTLLLMTSMIRNNQSVILCTKHFQNLIPGRSYVAVYTDSDPQTIGWIWSLFVVMIAPIIVTLYRCVKYCLFKKYKKPKLNTLLMTFICETINTIGLVLMVIMILPDMDASRGAMLSHSICLLPAILTFFSRCHKKMEEWRKTFIFLDLLSIFIQISCLIGWSVIAFYRNQANFWAIPVVLVFLSVGHWDNYFTIKDEKYLNKFFKYFCEIRKDLNKSRYFTYALISIWKIILIFGIILIYFAITNSQMVHNLFIDFDTAFSEHTINITRAVPSVQQDMRTIQSKPSIYLWIIAIQIISTFMCYLLAKFVCKIQIQVFSFTFPLTIVSPIAIVLISLLCRLRIRPEFVCSLSQVLRLEYIFWNSNFDLNDEILTIDYIESVVWILSIFSQIWVTLHVWHPMSERLAKTEKLFSKPEFSSLFIDQTLLLNRKIDDNLNKNDRKLSAEELEQSNDETVRIYLCATMWHENRDEMIQMLKSVFRMDFDQSARRQARTYLNANRVDYYEIEIHILFDDAFEYKNSESVVNSFVKQFIEVIDMSASCVHECQISLKPPILTTTPYGGQLVWTLPGQNKLYVHLKDKNLIRHKKRWSQVMYMYYLLGFKLRDLEKEKLDKIAENTFILALDGDINFQPKAVRLLVDLMIKQKNLGAACGRIHPVGSGPMVWYQKFEYAIGHWLQKATEHVIGCVLCSPGCFSLFRAKALMSENVMNKYTSKACEPMEYVQYDQGEDRWLCTLLLQKGWRIEYCAASDSYTHAPEGYAEFYNQRRRWAPSTLFNIWDLLKEYKRTVQINDNISTLYIAYQFALMVGTVFGPGTIFLMIVGAMNTSFSLNSGLCLLYSGTPILIFIIVCFYAKNDTQIKVSIVLSIGYALLMLAVIVSTVMEMVEEGLWQPTALFFISLCLSFLIAALIHPTEFSCFLPILLYMLCIPSMYLLLTIYSIINLNVISWGTREVHSVSEQQTEDKSKPVDNKMDFLKYFNAKKLFKKNSKLLSCVCCSSSSPNDDKEVLKEINEMKDQLNDFKSIVLSDSTKINPLMSPMTRFQSSRLPDINEDDIKMAENNSKQRNEFIPEHISEIYDNIGDDKPFWTKEKCFHTFPEQDLVEEELEFWRELIDSYLLPLDVDHKHEENVKFELIELRDKIAAAFGLLNSLFILLVLLLQMHKDVFEIRFSFRDVQIKIDIIGLILIIFFGFILLIQFFGMLWHRFNTFSLLLSVTEIKLFKRDIELTNAQQVIDENAVNIAKQLQKLNSNDLALNKRTLRQKRPEKRMLERLDTRPEFTELEDAFLKRVLSLKNNFDSEDLLPKAKLSRGARNATIRGCDVRKGVYDNVRNTIRRKQ